MSGTEQCVRAVVWSARNNTSVVRVVRFLDASLPRTNCAEPTTIRKSWPLEIEPANGASCTARYSLSRPICSTTNTCWSRSLCNSLLCLTIKPSQLSATLGVSKCLNHNESNPASRHRAICSRIGVSTKTIRRITAIISSLKACGPSTKRRLVAISPITRRQHHMWPQQQTA